MRVMPHAGRLRPQQQLVVQAVPAEPGRHLEHRPPAGRIGESLHGGGELGGQRLDPLGPLLLGQPPPRSRGGHQAPTWCSTGSAGRYPAAVITGHSAVRSDTCRYPGRTPGTR